jgi:hypothetical protein
MINTLLLSVWFIVHPVHVTLTSIDYIPERDSLKVFIKMYFDDFLIDVCFNSDSTAGEIFSAADPQSKNVTENYLNNNLILMVNKSLIRGKLSEMEIVDNEIKLNIGYCQISRPEVIVVKNLIMTKLYADQANLVIVKINKFEEGIKLTSDITEKTFNIN